jgi:DNA-binding CsgD family transcriptional regulator
LTQRRTSRRQIYQTQRNTAAHAEANQPVEQADRQHDSSRPVAGEHERLLFDAASPVRVTSPTFQRTSCFADQPVACASDSWRPDMARATRPRSNAGGLSHREVDVLRLAARGLTRRRSPIGLFISTKTADHHIQHIYKKIDVSTRATAALWAIQNAIVG